MKSKTRNLVSIVLPVITLFMIALTLKTQPTGLAVYENKALYRLNGSINITLQEEIPADSYIRVKIDSYTIQLNLIEFIGKSGKDYAISGNDLILNSTYSVDFSSLGIMQNFEEGNHRISVEIIDKGSILYKNEKIVEIEGRGNI